MYYMEDVLITEWISDSNITKLELFSFLLAE